MKFIHVASLLTFAAALLLGVNGCATHPRSARNPNSSRTCILTISIPGQAPSPDQFAVAKAKSIELLAAKGWIVVEDPAVAAAIVTIEFTPDAADPQHNGVARVVSITTNPESKRRVYAESRPALYTPPFGYEPTHYEYYYQYSDSSDYGSGEYRHGGSHPSHPPTPPPANSGGTTDHPKPPPPVYNHPPHDDSGHYRHHPDSNPDYGSSRSSSSDYSSSNSSSSSSSSYDSGSSSSGSGSSFSSPSSSDSGSSGGGGMSSNGRTAQPN